MSDCEDAPAIFIPDFGDMPQAVRFLLTVLERWADVRGSVDATEEELADYTGMNVSTVRRHMKWAADEARAWVSRSERRRLPNGQLSGYRYWLRLEKFGAIPGHRSIRAVDGGDVEISSSVANAVDEPPLNPPLNSSGGPRKPPLNSSGGAHKSSGGEAPENGGLEAVPRERARVFPFSNSSFLSFPWRDEALKVQASDVLAACGPMIGGLGEQNGRLLHSLAYVLETGLWAEFDWTLDVLPVVKLKTGPGQARVLWDFALLTSNIARHRRLRVAPDGAARARPVSRAKAPPPADPGEQRAKRIVGLRATIAAIERGDGQLFMLPKQQQRLTGEFLDDAFEAHRRAAMEELAGLENAAAAAAASVVAVADATNGNEGSGA